MSEWKGTSGDRLHFGVLVNRVSVLKQVKHCAFNATQIFVTNIISDIKVNVPAIIVTHGSALHVVMAREKNGGSNQCVSSHSIRR